MFDTCTWLPDDHGELTVSRRLVAGACAGMTATALTHPLDTVRLRLALPGNQYKGEKPHGSSHARSKGQTVLPHSCTACPANSIASKISIAMSW